MMKTYSGSECSDTVTFDKQSTCFLSLHVIQMGFVSAYHSVKAGSSPETLQSALSVFLENRKACASDVFLLISYFSPRVGFAVESIVHAFMFLLRCNVPSLPLTLCKS